MDKEKTLEIYEKKDRDYWESACLGVMFSVADLAEMYKWSSDRIILELRKNRMEYYKAKARPRK